MELKKLIFLIALLLSTASCVVIKELIPQSSGPSFPVDSINRFDGELADKSEIAAEYFYVKGLNEPHTPPNVQPTENLKKFLTETQGVVDLNRSGVMRYYNTNGKKKPSKIIVMIPGIYSAAGTLSNLSCSIKRRIKDCEVWIWERRSNQLEDRRIILKALDENDPKILTGLYEKNSFKLKDKAKAFYQPSTEDIAFEGYWGLNLFLTDLYNIIEEARKRSDEVILAGYSLGVLYATLFLANDFQVDGKKIAGYSLVDKVMLLDGPPMIDGYVQDEATYDQGTTMIPYNIIEGRLKLESGKYYPACGTVDRDMTMFFNVDVKSALAQIDPYGLSIEPYDTGIKKLPIDNLSKFLVAFDDNYNDFKLFTATFGRADAKHIGTFSYNSTVRIVGLSPGKDHITWIPRKKGDKTEFNDYREYLKANNDRLFNMADWYQPTRILLDVGSIHNNDTSTGWQKKYFNLTENKNINIPFLCLGLARGLSPKMSIYLDYKKLINPSDFTIVMINDITHLDGDTVTDDESRPVVADVIANYLDNKKIVNEDMPDYDRAFYHVR